ncbi:hypothetical protein HV306_11355 [Klebsiella grimontii]|uniref:phage tail fiber domain-containing protein n=1 Tax=Klebsiella grimontii TaxID=2058152 RepID=UPI0015E58825|nr:phage tail fiber protein [Klebsiella grimontii]QLO77650.1 hypothetical protein HV306_11355 [Klebsiella grimontii]
MSVPNQTPYNIYTANGLSTVFAYEFYLISASDIQVTINGNEVTSGFTVSGVGNTSGGEVTFITAPANGSTVIFERVTPTYRLTDYQDNGDLLADTVNKDFDRLWMAIQRAFIYLGVTLSRPLFGGGPYNAGGFRISNLGDPIDDQDAATKKYVTERIGDNSREWKAGDAVLDRKIDANFLKTLRVAEESIKMLPPLTARRNSLLGWNSEGDPVPIFSMTDTADLAFKLASGDNGLGDSLVMHFPGGAYTSPRLVNDVLREGVSILNWDSDSKNDDTLRFKKAILEGHKVIKIPQRSVSGPFRVAELDITVPMVLQGEGVISIDSTGSTIMKIAEAAYAIQFLGDKNDRPHGGGLRNIDLRGATDYSTGILLRVESWSYFWCEMLALQNMAGWGASLRNVAEGGIHNYLCRRLGSETTGCIRFEDYLDNPNNNVNNFSLWHGTFGFNSGTWIYGTDQSNLDVVSIENHKFEYDDKPVSGNLTQKSVIYLGQANRVNIKRNFFTNFKLTNANLYTNCMRIGANSRVKPNISDNQFSGCDNSLLKIEGGTVEGYGNVANRGDATADGTFVCTSNLPQDIEPITFHTNNGAKNKRSNYDAPGFISAHKMTGLVNNPFISDANSMTHYGTVMSVAAATEIRRGTISRALISDREFVHITARMKNVTGTASSVILNLDGVDFGSVSVTADSQWHNYTWQIRPDKISNGSFILTNGASPILFDGVFIEKKNYLNWSFAWVTGTIAAGQAATSPVQSVADTTGFVATGVEATANGSLNGTTLQPSMDADGNVIIYCKNNTASSITPSFSRIRLRYESAGRIS